jgi:hypothetical protein
VEAHRQLRQRRRASQQTVQAMQAEQAGAAVAGNRIACYVALDGNDTYDVVFLQSHLSTVAQELIVLV